MTETIEVRKIEVPWRGDAPKLTEYGYSAVLRIVRMWEKYGFEGFNRARLEKVIEKYHDIEFVKGWEFAQDMILDLHGVSVFHVRHMFPKLIEWTPEHEAKEEEFWENFRRENNDYRKKLMLNGDVLHCSPAYKQIKFGVNVFCNMELGATGRFFAGFIMRKNLIRIFFEKGYSIIIEIESFRGDDLAKELRCYWMLINSKNDVLRDGAFIDRSLKDIHMISSRALEECLNKVFVFGERVEKGSKWPISVEESENIYTLLGPFILKNDIEEADYGFERKDGMLFMV